MIIINYRIFIREWQTETVAASEWLFENSGQTHYNQGLPFKDGS